MSSPNHTLLPKRKKELLQPYPYMVRTFLGSSLASIIVISIFIIGYLSYHSISTSMNFIQQKIHEPWSIASIKTLPIPKVLAGQSHREIFINTSIPYLEKITLPLTDSARQADFALIQTLTRLNMGKDHFYLVSTEYKHNNNETFHFQKIRLFLPESIDVFLTTLQEHLDVWAEHVSIIASNNYVYKLTINNIPTHELILTPINDNFILSPLDEKPRISIVIDDLGENLDLANILIEFDIPLTLSIWPDSNHAKTIALAAHNAGKEILIHQPMQSIQSPYVSAGPNELTTKMSPKEIEKILHGNIKKVPFALGMNNHMGSAFTCNTEGNSTVCKVLIQNGLFALDSVTHSKSSFYDTAQKQGLAAYRRTMFLDDGIRSEASILQRLKNAEKIAYATGKVIIIGHPYPETIAALKKWVTIRDTSIHIVPLRYQPIVIESLESNLSKILTKEPNYGTNICYY